LPNSVVTAIIGKPISKIYAEENLKRAVELKRQSGGSTLCPLLTLPFIYCFAFLGRGTEKTTPASAIKEERTSSTSDGEGSESSSRDGPIDESAQTRAAITMQAQVRGWASRTSTEEQAEKKQELVEAAIFVQSVWRGRAGRGAFQRLANTAAAAQEKETELAAVKIQSSLRGNNGYKEAQVLKQVRAATRLQNLFRSRRSRGFINAVMEVVQLTKNLPHEQRRALFEYLADASIAAREHLHAGMKALGAPEQTAYVEKLLAERQHERKHAAERLQRMVRGAKGRVFMQIVLHAIRLTKHLPKEQRKQLTETMACVSPAEGQQMSQALGRMSAAQRAVYVQHLQEDGDEGEDDGVVALNKDELKAASQWA
jgi:hypothetical protein